MIWALLVMIVGAIGWVFVEGPSPKAAKIAELGRIMFKVGLFWALYLALGIVINLRN